MVPIRWEAFGDNAFTHAMLWLNAYFSFAWFLGKCALGISVYVWIRATLPRLRYDQRAQNARCSVSSALTS